jgi:tetratricopeptide (TPR) repeat protein
MIIRCFILLAVLIPVSGRSQDVSVHLNEARQLESTFKDAEALQKYVQVLSIQPNNLIALCKASELYNIVGKRQATKSKQKEYYVAARTYAQKALQINPNYPDANFAMAVAAGRLALMASGEEKIKAVKQIKQYADRCVQLDPKNFKGYHILGKWHYEVSDLNSVERWLVKVAFEALPPSSLRDAIRNYEKSQQLNPGFLLNYLELAKAYRRNGEKNKAIAQLQTLLKLPIVTSDDSTIKKKGKELLDELS